MNSANAKWADIISSVEKAHLQATRNLKVRERLLNRKYVEEADQQMRRKQEEETQRRCEELEERLIIEEDARRDEETRKISREMKLKREKQYSKDNLQLMLASPSSDRRNSAYPQNSYSEHPFTSLVDQADKRRENFRQKLRRQNEMNQLQEKIKQKEQQERRLSEKEQKEKYVSHVQAFYLKKIQDRNAFKDKYLKLSNPEKSQLLLSSSPLHDTIEKQYETMNGQLMKSSKLKPTEVDDVLSSINRHIGVPDSSPAFLGRIPINADRKRQLDYIQRSAFRGNLSDKKRLKTQGDICDSAPIEAKRYCNQTQELPALEKYYKNFSLAHQFDSKIPQKSNQDPASISPIVNYRKVYQSNMSRNTTNLIRQKEPISVTPSKHQQILSGYQRSYNTTAKKVYSTYDIIQNRRKFVCI